MKKIFFLLIIIICVYNCKYRVVSPQSNSDVTYYKDFDLFNLRGQNKIDEKSDMIIEYPYVEIKEGANHKIVNFIYSNSSSFTREYFKYKSMWTFDYVVEASKEGCTYYRYQYIANNSIIQIEYCGNPKSKDYYLTDVSIRTKEKYESYYFSRFGRKIKILPTFNIKKYPLSEAHSKEETFYEEKDAVLIVKSKNIDWQRKKILNKNTTCYAKNGLGFVWWYFWWQNFQETDCSFYD
jgi:hypothetical protein